MHLANSNETSGRRGFIKRAETGLTAALLGASRASAQTAPSDPISHAGAQRPLRREVHACEQRRSSDRIHASSRPEFLS